MRRSPKNMNEQAEERRQLIEVLDFQQAQNVVECSLEQLQIDNVVEPRTGITSGSSAKQIIRNERRFLGNMER